MTRWIGSWRWHRALVALVLVLAHGATTAMAATRCFAQESPAFGAEAATVGADSADFGSEAHDGATEAAESVPHTPDLPSGPGTATCAAGFLTAAPTVELLASESDRVMPATAETFPRSVDSPPPFQPPRI